MKRGVQLLLILATSLSLVACGGKSYSEITWFDLELGDKLPIPSDSIKGEIECNDDKSLQVLIAKISVDDFESYVEACKNNGFNLNSYSNETYYSADNSLGYGLSVDMNEKNKTMTISLDGYNLYGDFTWPDSDLARLLPVPDSTYGVIEWENLNGFVIDVANITLDDFNNYVSACKDNGFTVDYQSGSDYYWANDEVGNKLSLRYQDGDVMFIRIDSADESSSEDISESNSSTSEESTIDITSDNVETTDDFSEETAKSESSDDGIRPEFKEAMDSYESFMNEYCEFMEKYNSSDDVTSMLSDYTDYMTQYVETMKKIDDIGEEEMSSEEAIYYTEVTTRVSKKLLEVGAN